MQTEAQRIFYSARVVRSGRKAIGIRVCGDGTVELRAPYRASEKDLLLSIERNLDWIGRTKEKVFCEQRKFAGTEPFTEAELSVLASEAKQNIPKRVEYFASLLGVTYGRITVRAQLTLWGSCTAKGNLSFNMLLALCPPEVLDAVVLHELCHRKQLNHSEKFYKELYRYCPDYEKYRRWLKTEGKELLLRMKKTKEAR